MPNKCDHKLVTGSNKVERNGDEFKQSEVRRDFCIEDGRSEQNVVETNAFFFFECTIPRNNDASDFKWSKLIYIYIYIHIIAGRDFSPPHWFVE